MLLPPPPNIHNAFKSLNTHTEGNAVHEYSQLTCTCRLAPSPLLTSLSALHRYRPASSAARDLMVRAGLVDAVPPEYLEGLLVELIDVRALKQ